MTNYGPRRLLPPHPKRAPLLTRQILYLVVCVTVRLVVALYLTAGVKWGQILVAFLVIR